MGNRANKSETLAVLIATWPNLLSLARLLSLPLIIWLIDADYFMYAFIAFLIAGLTDMFDGLLARLSKTASHLGEYLDPIADKVLLVGLFITLGFKGYLAPWLVILITFRDLLIVGGLLLLFVTNKLHKIKPVLISKINTVLQIALVSWILYRLAFVTDNVYINDSLITLVTVTTIVSGISYVMIFLKSISQSKEDNATKL